MYCTGAKSRKSQATATVSAQCSAWLCRIVMSVSVESGHYSDKDVEFEGQGTSMDGFVGQRHPSTILKGSEDF